MDTNGLPLLAWFQPPEERDDARHIGTQLTMLAFHEERFRSAGELMDHAAQLATTLKPKDHDERRHQDRVQSWRMIAAHAAVLSVYHFRSTLASIRDRLGQCPALAKHVDQKAIEKAFDQIEVDFPHWREVRDGVGHFSDKIFKPADVDAHMPDKTAFHHGCLVGSNLIFTRDGKYVAMDLSIQSLEKLVAIKRMVWEAFRKAAA